MVRSQQHLEQGIGLVMAAGLALAGLLLAASVILFSSGNGEPGRLIAVWGILLLVSTPMVRVAMCLEHFTLHRDWKFVALTLWVLLAMLLDAIIGIVL